MTPDPGWIDESDRDDPVALRQAVGEWLARNPLPEPVPEDREAGS